MIRSPLREYQDALWGAQIIAWHEYALHLELF
jgi:hypothetical protein